MSSTLTTLTGSEPVTMPNTTVSDAPMPTQTAYAVPVGRVRIAKASPAMLSARPTPKTNDGTSRENPSERPSATAQTASRTPETTSTDHAMTTTLRQAVLSQSGYGSLVRRAVGLVAPGSHADAPGGISRQGWTALTLAGATLGGQWPLLEPLTPRARPVTEAPTRAAGSEVTLIWWGEIDLGNATDLSGDLLQAIETASHVYVDLTGVTFMDSSGIGVLVNGWRRARSEQVTLTVCEPTGQVRRTLESTGLLDLMSQQPTVP
jgi:anti-sigma B factor antagonist